MSRLGLTLGPLVSTVTFETTAKDAVAEVVPSAATLGIGDPAVTNRPLVQGALLALVLAVPSW